MLTILFGLVANVRKHLCYFVRTWVCVFALEMLTIIFLPREQLDFLGLQGEAGGFWYWQCFTVGLYQLVPSLLLVIIHGHGKDFLGLLLLPLVPATATYWVGYREVQANKVR